MKKCNCIVVYTRTDKYYIIQNVTVKVKNCINTELVTLYKTEYVTFSGMYDAILKTLKNNNLYVGKWNEFNRTWYDIDFIDTNTYGINRYSL